MNALIPTDAVVAKNGRPITSSIKVAEAFSRRHKDILRAVRNVECSDEFRGRNFAPTSYIDIQGKTMPAVELTEDGWILLVMGFTGPQAARIKEAYIAAFNAMRAQLVPGQRTLPAPAGGLSIDPAEYIELLKAKIALLEGRRQRRLRGPAPVPLSPAERSRILALRAEGLGFADIARAVHRSRSAVRAVVREQGG